MLLYKIDLFFTVLTSSHNAIIRLVLSNDSSVTWFAFSWSDSSSVSGGPSWSAAAIITFFRFLCAHKNKYMVSWITIQALLKHSVYFNNPLHFYKCLFVASPPLKYILELFLLIAYHSKSEMKQAFIRSKNVNVLCWTLISVIYICCLGISLKGLRSIHL